MRPNVKRSRVANQTYRQELIQATRCHLRRGNIRRDCDIYLIRPNQPRRQSGEGHRCRLRGRAGGCTQNSGWILRPEILG
jgi:hypothetical protein